MLKKLEREVTGKAASVTMREAEFPIPFKQGLEYSSPARGNWNIVHTGMLIPQAHEIFVCAQGCLRGVVLTAAEMNAMGRYSSISIREENVLDGTMEELMIEGVTDILHKLNEQPRVILLFISCQHFFLAYDQKIVFQTLRERFPEIRFADCYMIPTLRKSGLTPDQKMRVQLYSMLTPKEKKPELVNLIGSNLLLSPSCEIRSIIGQAGCELQEIGACKTFDEYLDMASASLNLIYEPIAKMAGKDLEERLGQKYLYLPFVFQTERLEENYQLLADTLGIPKPDFTKLKETATECLRKARKLIGDTPVVVDYTFTFRILSFTRMLLEHDFHVTTVYADSLLLEEADDFQWLKENYPELVITATSRPEMRFMAQEPDRKILAIGQKAAYFSGTDYFVNVAESGGFYGYDGMIQIADLMMEAFLKKKDRKQLIQKKGYGCESCI